MPSFTAIPAQPTLGQDPWYTTETAWKDAVEAALTDIDDAAIAHAGTATVHVPSGGTSGQVLRKVSNTTGDYSWQDPPSGGVVDHGALTGLADADHPIAAVIGLQAALDGKSATSHTHNYDAAGAATAEVAAHTALADPHPVYMTAAETAAAYATLARGLPAAGTTGQVLQKTSGADYAVGWVTPSTGGAVAPLALSGATAAQIPLTVTGAASQTAAHFEVRLNDGTVGLGVTSIGEVRSGININAKNGHLRVGVADPARNALLLQGAASQTGKLILATDSAGTEQFSVSSNGTVAGKNIGAPVLVLDAAAAVPASAVSGTVIFRRPA